MAVVALPIVAAVAGSVLDGWTPVGDNATLALRVGDVLRGDPPLVGMPTTSNTISEEDLSHPGPIEAWVAAIPVALVGPVGLLVVAGAANVIAACASVRIAWRRGRAPLAALTAAVLLGTCWSLGATVLRDPLNSHVQLLTWFAFGLLCWDVRLGRWRSLPWAAVAAAWATQNHVVYLLPTAVVALGTLALVAADERRSPPDERTRRARGRAHELGLTAVVSVALFAPVLIDQLTGSGNLGHLLRYGGEDGQGPTFALRGLVTALGAPPSWLRTGNDPLALLRGPTMADLLAFSATIALLAWSYRRAHRAADRRAEALVQAALLALGGVALVLARVPLEGAVLAVDPLLILRPTTALVALAIAWSCWRELEPRARRVGAVAVLRAAAWVVLPALSVVLAATSLVAPSRRGGFGDREMPAAAILAPAAADAARGQALVEVNASGWAARLYLRHAVIERLERDGIRAATPDDARVFGRPLDERGPATLKMWVVSAEGTPEPPTRDAELVARVDLVEGGRRSDVAARRTELRQILDRAGRVRLRSTDRISVSDISREYFRWEDPPPDDERLPAEWIGVDAFVDLDRSGLVASPTVEAELVDAIAADNVGRYFAGGDTEAALYIDRP